MPQPGEVTSWLNGLRVGEEAAARNLWEEYFRRLIGLARARLGGRPRGPDEPEDIALSAFDSFCRGVAHGRFARLNDRDDLWQVLMMLTSRKAINAIRRENAAKRAGKTVDLADTAIDEVISPEPTASFALAVTEQCRRLLELLKEPELRTIALCRLEGYTNSEIAKLLGRSLSAIERKVALIRQCWEELDADA